MRINVLRSIALAATLITGQAQAALYYFHNDHLGTPQVVTDTSGDVVWEGHYSPFGEVEETTALVQQDLRFPGQLLDRETGLHYNYFRDYNPQTGRYTTSDPIGLEGGVNTFGYADQNSLRYIDPYGLISSCLINGGSFYGCVLPAAGETVAGIPSSISARASAVGECIKCEVKCVVEFYFGTELPLAGEAYTSTAKKGLKEIALITANEFVDAAKRIAERQILLPLTIAGAAKAAVCIVNCN